MRSFSIFINIALFTTYFIGTFVNMWHSWVWSTVLALLLAGSASQNIFFAFIAYPALEYYMVGHLTIFSALSVGINAFMALVIFGYIYFNRNKYSSDEWG